MEHIIEVKNLGKRYTIGHERLPYHSLRDDLVGLIKKPIRWLRGHRENQEDFWALKDINFEVKRGEVLGIIGANGAGKSTLLKILSRITYPTEGEIRMHGRVGSLLEVGTGFHPELTGRENIYLNGVILGMTKKEIDRKFDEIIHFAGIERFLDTPVKHYSSGMYVRLAFSVAAHLEPDILIVDEVLAVGDADFQKKSLGKMEEITKKEGRTILFVSHNMDAIQSICKKCIFLDQGRIKMMGDSQAVIGAYLHDETRTGPVRLFDPDPQKKQAQILRVAITDQDGNATSELDVANPFFIEMEYELKDRISAYAVVKIFSSVVPNVHLLVTWSNDNNYENPTEKGRYIAKARIDPLFNVGTYSFLVGIATHSEDYIDKVAEYNAIFLQNLSGLPFPAVMHRTDALVVYPEKWDIKSIEN